MAAVRPTRILALPGFGQSSQMFRSKTGSLRKRLKNVHFEFVDPPFTSKHESIGEGLSWYEFSTVGEDEVKWSRFDESLQYISEVFTSRGPFDGVMGFSQGACVAALLSVLRERDSLPPPVQFQFVWLFSGFCPKDPEWRKLCLETQVRKISSVHVIGETDQIISPQRSTEVLLPPFQLDD